MKRISKTAKKVTSRILAILAALPTIITGEFAVYASDISSSKIATGTEKLINDLTTWLLVLAPIAGGACVIFFAIRRAMSDEQEQKQWNNRIIAAIVSVVVAVLASTIIKLLSSYYS